MPLLLLSLPADAFDVFHYTLIVLLVTAGLTEFLLASLSK